MLKSSYSRFVRLSINTKRSKVMVTSKNMVYLRAQDPRETSRRERTKGERERGREEGGRVYWCFMPVGMETVTFWYEVSMIAGPARTEASATLGPLVRKTAKRRQKHQQPGLFKAF